MRVLIFFAQVLAIAATIVFALYCYYYFDNVHFHITRGYAHLGYATAQHQVGQRYLNGMYTMISFSHVFELLKGMHLAKLHVLGFVCLIAYLSHYFLIYQGFIVFSVFLAWHLNKWECWLFTN